MHNTVKSVRNAGDVRIKMQNRGNSRWRVKQEQMQQIPGAADSRNKIPAISTQMK